MPKQKKKRNKPYRGKDAKNAPPEVIRVEAVDRSKPKQWWHEKKSVIKPVAIAAVVILIIIWLLFELFRAVF